MFKNYIKILFRNITKNIVYVLINTIGLGLALTVCIVAYLNYKFDVDFDSIHEKKDRIFRIEHSRLNQGNSELLARTPSPLGPTIADNIGSVEKVVRIGMDLLENIQLFKVGENEIYKRLIYADQDIFDVFTFPLIAGHKNSFRDKNIFITERLARILFGDQNPMGNIIEVSGSLYTIGGILKDHPLNSSFHFDAVAPIHHWFKINQIDESNWDYFLESTFILVNDQVQAQTTEESLQQFVPVINNARKGKQQVERLYLAPFKDMAHHKRDGTKDKFRKSLHPALVIPPLIAAACILLIACFNFINITIAIAGQRLKEIGIRKVVGGNKRQLVLQFMSENLLMSFIALIFAVIFAGFLVPSYSNMWDFMNLSFSITQDPHLLLFLIVLLIITAILSGAYPAYYISSFSTANIFRDKLKLGGNNIFSKIILTIQFGISVLALFTGITLIQNANYQKRFDLGYDGEHLIEVWIDKSYSKVYKNAIRNYHGIESICKPISRPFFKDRSIKYNGIERQAVINYLGMETFNTMGLRLFEGRSFELQSRKTDEKSSIMVNKKFIEEFGLKEPVGKIVKMNDTIPLRIIGVIDNLLEDGVWSTGVYPSFYRLSNDDNQSTNLLIRTAPENRPEIYQYLENEWNKLVPDLPFLGIEGDIYMLAAQDINKNIFNISIFLIIIATLLTAAGLYSQVSLCISRRTKEIGIRKIFGASIPTIIKILSGEFLAILSISSIIGLVAGYFANIALLDKIWEYFTEVTTGTFIIPVLLIFTISIITIYGKVYYAATRNPVHSLRHE